MTISERELEENEAKLDNILHKIVEASKKIQELRASISADSPVLYISGALESIDTLAKIIENLTALADAIDVRDEKITKDLEKEINAKLDEAISRISDARKMLEE